MRKIRLAGIISAAMLAAGCVFAAVSPAVFAVEEKGERSVSIPEVFPLYTEMTYDGALVKTEVSDLEGELLKDYIADHLVISSPDGGAVYQEFFHIYDRSGILPVVSLFMDDGMLVSCVEDPASGLMTLYRIGGASEGFRVLETESVSLSDTIRVSEIRALQYYGYGLPEETDTEEESSLEDETDTAEESSLEDETDTAEESDAEDETDTEEADTNGEPDTADEGDAADETVTAEESDTETAADGEETTVSDPGSTVNEAEESESPENGSSENEADDTESDAAEGSESQSTVTEASETEPEGTDPGETGSTETETEGIDDGETSGSETEAEETDSEGSETENSEGSETGTAETSTEGTGTEESVTSIPDETGTENVETVSENPSPEPAGAESGPSEETVSETSEEPILNSPEEVPSGNTSAEDLYETEN